MKPICQLEKIVARALGAIIHDLDNQRLWILHCTAHAMTSSHGGPRFKSGIRPWLEGLPPSLSTSSRHHTQPRPSGMQPSAS